MCLPPPGAKYTGQKCWVTGWGQVGPHWKTYRTKPGQDAFSGGGELQARLQEVDVPVVGRERCATLPSAPAPPSQVPEGPEEERWAREELQAAPWLAVRRSLAILHLTIAQYC